MKLKARWLQEQMATVAPDAMDSRRSQRVVTGPGVNHLYSEESQCLMAELMDKMRWLSKEAPPPTTVTIPAG